VADSNISADVLIVGGGSAGGAGGTPPRTRPDGAAPRSRSAYALDEIPSGLLDADHVADPGTTGITARANDHQLGVPAAARRSETRRSMRPSPFGRPSDLASGRRTAEGWSYDEVLPTYRNMENTPPATISTTVEPVRSRSGSDRTTTDAVAARIHRGCGRWATRKCTTSTASRTGLVDIRLTSSTGSARHGARVPHARVRRRSNLTIKVVSAWTACCSTARRRSASSPTTAPNRAAE
jgi:choline dehydrogenase